MAQNSLVIVVGNETMTASTPAEIYRRLGQLTATLENDTASTDSEEDTNYIERLLDTARKEVAKVNKKLTYSFVGRDRAKKLMRTVGEWINKIDDLIAYRAGLILLTQSMTFGSITEWVQRFDLPNTRNQIGLRLTHSTTLPPSVEHDSKFKSGCHNICPWYCDPRGTC